MWRFVLILLLSPVLTAIPGVLFPPWIFAIALGYPIVVLTSCVFLPWMHSQIKRGTHSKTKLAIFFVFMGGVVGGFIGWILGWNAGPTSADDLAYLVEKVFPFAVLGALQVLSMWILYTFGPLNIRGITQQ